MYQIQVELIFFIGENNIMLLFKEKFNHDNPLNIVFLCGNQYRPEDQRDKRHILKEFLLNSNLNCQIVILEEHFSFAKNNTSYLAYDDIFVKNLSEVENLAAMYADKIIIIHETISTAAEIGMFASNPLLTTKICILFPDDISIEERKMSAFIKYAFFNKGDKINPKPRKIKYYPDVEVYRSSANKSDYYTYFHENKIGKNLGDNILKFVSKSKRTENIEIKQKAFGKTNNSKNVVSYFVDKDDAHIDVSVYSEVLKIQLFSMFTVNEFRTEFRKVKTLSEHISFIEREYKQLLLNTIGNIEGIETNDYTLNLEIIGVDSCKLRQAIGYYLYMLQAAGFISLEQLSASAENGCRKIKIKQQLEKCVSNFRTYIYEKPTTEFGGII